MFAWFSDSVEKYGSKIEGTGLRAVRPVPAGALLVIKGGHVFTRERRDELAKTLGPSEIQIDDDLFIGPDRPEDRGAGMMYLNHSCDPNVGIVGQIAFHAMRDIAAGEELAFDYATGDDDDWTMECRCGAENCRGTVTGQDWRLSELQARYAGWFSAYLQRKIAALQGSERASLS
jgi:SET domain-containing protein